MQTQTLSGFQLSHQQKRLWLLQQDSSVYLTQGAIRIEGTLEIEILKSAIKQVINRHGILRTKFRRLPGIKIPVMTLTDSCSFLWQDSDLTNDTEQVVSLKIESLITEETRKVFDLEQAVLHLHLLQLSSNEYILLVSMPALCADNWTMKNLVNEISNTYYNLIKGDKFLDEAAQYLQFSEWQNQLFQDEDAANANEYWQKQKLSDSNTLTLPFEKNSLKKSGFEIDYLRLVIAPNVMSKLVALAQKYNTSESLVLLACWQTLIWRLTAKSDIVIGMAVERREYEELHSLMGLVATWLPIKSHLAPELHLREVIEIAQQNLDAALEWQDYFVPELLENDTNLAFPIGFEFEQLPKKRSAADPSFSLEEYYSCIEQFKVKLTCTWCDDCLLADFYYDVNCFSADTIQRLTSQFHTLLDSVTKNPETPISQLEILTQSACQQLLVEFNQTHIDYPKDKCIHQLFEEQASKTPNNIAVVFEDQKLTYAELNKSANQLAYYLQKLGVEKDVVVGIATERSHLMLVAMLGILKAGGAYLPLDPTLPTESLAFRLQDAQASILLTQQGIDSISDLKSKVPNQTLVYLDTDWEIISSENTGNPLNKVTHENLVYVIYTSGSTGKPKGVAIEHQQLSNYLYGILEKLELPAGVSFASVSTFAADLGNTMIFPSLCTGGCLHIVSWERASDAAALAEYFRCHVIDCLKIVPSHLAALLSSGNIESILPRQLLIFGGEAAGWQLIETIQQHVPNCRIINHYGPTETTVGVLTYAVNKQKYREQKSQTVPIGKPIANTQIYVLDDNQKPVAMGVPGELYIGGKSLARGYINRPELTKERFIINPFLNFESGEFTEKSKPLNPIFSQRLYRTGDLVCYLPDGNIEFLGRLDNQVKIRGFRIELGEIEATLSQYPAVQGIAVIATEEELGDRRLIAYIVPNNDERTLSTQHSTLINDLRNFLKEKLPEYMIPSAFVVLKALPLTANGKVDRYALPAPDAVLQEKTFVVPRNPIEEVLAGIWSQLLGVSPLSIDDDFFDLGGHSLLATQIISRIRIIFGVEIPLRQLFVSSTVAKLAVHIEAAIASSHQQMSLISPVSRDRDLPLSFAQWRLWFFQQLEPESSTYNLLRAIRLTGVLNITALQQSFNEILRRHEVLRTTFATINGQPLQVIHPKIDLKLPIVDLTQIQNQESTIQNFLLEEAQQSFDLAQGPLLRTTLLRLGEEEHVLILTLHHIVSDAWSTGVLVSESAALYAAFCEGKPSPLEELPIQYADFAIWQREWLQQQQLQTQLDYWKKQLQGNLPVLELKSDRPRPAIQTFAGEEYSLVLPKELSQALKKLSQQEGVTLFMTLLAAFKTLLYRYTGQTDILIGSPIANRNRAEIENLIGFFVNTLVLRTDLSDNPSFIQLLARVRDCTLSAYAHQDLPFEKLLEELQPERDTSHMPLFQVMFVLQNTPSKTLELPSLRIQPIEVKGKTAKFDLTLFIEDTEHGLIASFEYNTDLFDQPTICRLGQHFQTLLAGIITNPTQHLCELSLLTATEQQQLREWNSTATDYENELCLHQLFELQAQKTPDAVAVVFENQQITYQELNCRANQLAHYLQKLGVKPEVLVGICVERSLEMIIGLLGILKAGGAYVPLDPSYPQQRLAFMLENSQTPVLLCQQHLVKNFPAHTTKLVCLDTNWELITDQSSENPVCNLTPDNLAYVIYTSGSTGRPKGAMNTHRGVANFLTAMQQQFGLTNQDSLLSVTTLSFDIAVLELFLPLTVGAKVILASREVAIDGTQLLKRLKSDITVMQATPATWRMLLEAGWQSNPQLKILCGGEALPAKLAQQLRQRSAGVWNLYGPTETTIWSTIHQVDERETSVPIGRPIANTQIYLLDPNFNLVPVGVIGELYIGGVGVGRGYLHNPQLTSEKFIPNPFSDNPGARLYKSGDLACYLPDGTIEFLGRIDYQLKVRGFRIELGEIEAVLSQHPAVGETVVVIREDTPGDKRLVAYLVPTKHLQQDEIFNSSTLSDNAEINKNGSNFISQLRLFLQERLPEYMLPSAFVLIESLPLTPSGKVNRQALPAPDISKGNLEIDFAPPRTSTEKVVANIWSQVLKREQVGIHDNFFDLGGHSLLATQVISRLWEAFKVELPLRSLFEEPTVAKLVKYIEKILTVQQLQTLTIDIADDREEIEL
ncbi:MAG: amino acid adenylation domain-containing protein [Calothrix sp. FI2-JRJ7]|jgi:amino acid adenylation domain-containing protein|nr:amino acid adenylation domain-containing protein [Calothrix sp. FI2-JRJ7]